MLIDGQFDKSNNSIHAIDRKLQCKLHMHKYDTLVLQHNWPIFAMLQGSAHVYDTKLYLTIKTEYKICLLPHLTLDIHIFCVQ